ncbi:MAG: acyl-CoA dehydrogenase family protein [Parachlamydiaceae bacterium]
MDEQQKKLAEELLFSNVEGGFVKSLLQGFIRSQNIFPFPQPSPEEKAKTEELILKVEAFAKVNIDGNQIDREASIPSHVIQGLAELGILGMTIPKEYGGLGLSQYAYCRVTETIARYCGSTALFINAY